MSGLRRVLSLALVAVALASAGCSDDGAKRAAPLPAAEVPADPSPGCGSAAAKAVAAGETQVDLGNRWYLRHVPPAHDGTKPVPLVVDIHGYSEGARIQALVSALGPYGDAEGFETVSPQGNGKVMYWSATPGSADVRFLSAMLDDIERDTCVDRNRVFVTGLSNGAMMTSVVACDLADRIAAVAPVAGVVRVSRCRAARPVPVLAFHGTDDPFLPYEGGLGAKALALPAPDGSGRTLGQLGVKAASVGHVSVPETMRLWAKRNGCGTTARERELAPDVTQFSWPCPAGADVVLDRIDGGGHTWPGSALLAEVGPIVGRTTTSVDATKAMWRFFLQHPLQVND